MRLENTFMKKTKSGKLIKVAREHYLRNDIPCGIPCCKKCNFKHLKTSENMALSNEEKFSDKLVQCSKLQSPAKSRSSVHTKRHYLVLDTNVVLKQIDLLEHYEENDSFENVVILQTVMKEVSRRSNPVYQRLHQLIYNSNRQYFLFMNEHHPSTFVSRVRDQSANDHNDLAIRKSISWLQKHIDEQCCVNSDETFDFILISDDAECRKKAITVDCLSGAYTASDYVKSIIDSSLIDKLNVICEDGEDDSNEEDRNINSRDKYFDRHLSSEEINVGIRNGTLIQGIFRVSNSNYLEASVESEKLNKYLSVEDCEEASGSVLIHGLRNQNRSIDGDVVVFQLLDRSEWNATSEVLLEDDEDTVAETSFDFVDQLESDLDFKKRRGLKPCGKIVSIMRRNWKQYCGILQDSSNTSGTGNKTSLSAVKSRRLFVPCQRKIPKIVIQTKQSERLLMKRVMVAMDGWPRHSRYPLGHFVRVVGDLGDPKVDTEVILLEHDIPHTQFSSQVRACLPPDDWKITDDEIAKRLDLRHLDICSVDPPGCTDIDDALHCRKLENGNFEVGVHIADVSHFVRPDTALDKEAYKRSTTVYLCDQRIDMVPERLSSDLCSLHCEVDRLAFSIIWEMSSVEDAAQIISTTCNKTVISSRAAFTYEEAQNKIDDPNDTTAIASSLRNLRDLARVMRDRRIQDGSLVLASSEVRFDIDRSETGDNKLLGVQLKASHDTNWMVEEFMLAANVSAAKLISKEFSESAMLRRHPEPPADKFEPLIKAFECQGYELCTKTSKDLADSLDKAVSDINPYMNTMLRMITTRCMVQAVYFASGTLSEELWKHYGLACHIYTHFTSPIRRYSDVMVHRMLAVICGADLPHASLSSKSYVDKIADNANYRHRMAQFASRASVNLHTHIFFKGKSSDEEGYVLYVLKNAIKVFIPKYGLEGVVKLDFDSTVEMSDTDEQKPTFIYDEDVPSQTYGDVTLKLFDKLKVRIYLDSSNVQHEKLILKLVEPDIPGFSLKPADGMEVDVAAVNQSVKRLSKLPKCSGDEKKKKKRKSDLSK